MLCHTGVIYISRYAEGRHSFELWLDIITVSTVSNDRLALVAEVIWASPHHHGTPCQRR